MKQILVLGNEPRQEYLFRLLKKQGYFAERQENFVDKQDICRYDVILLPVPAHLTNQYMEQMVSELGKEQLVFGCGFSEEMKSECKAGLIDYMEGDEVAYYNAIATAEGTIAEAINRSAVNLHHSHSLVIGYGRCGEVLVEKLLSLHSYVTVMDRTGAKLAKAESLGFSVMDFPGKAESLSQFDFVFNTVPATVVDKKMLEKLSTDITIIDIASGGGGVDYEFCKKNQINANLCLGLPGKYAPKSSAAILLKVIEKVLGE